MLPWDLEDWLTAEGDKVVRKAAAANSDDVLTPIERLLCELWLFDTEQRNGGVSQYFGNHGLANWLVLSNLAAKALPTFEGFAKKVDAVIKGADDPYEAVINSAVDLDTWYLAHQVRLVTELRAAVEASE